MNQTNRPFRDSVLTAASLALLYIAFACIPFSWLDASSAVRASGAARFFFLFLAVFLLKRDGHAFSLRPKFQGWILPLFLLCFTNLLVCLIDPANRADFNGSSLLDGFFFDLSVALAEEFVFREAFQKTLSERFKPISRILIAAAIFALCHGVNALSSGLSTALAQIGYTFVLGIFLGFVYEGCGLFPAVFFHLLFDFLETDLFLALGGGTWDVPFYLVNLIGGALLLAYAFFFYWIRKKKAEVHSAISE